MELSFYPWLERNNRKGKYAFHIFVIFIIGMAFDIYLL